MVTRVISCQGSIQLATALAAAGPTRTRNEFTRDFLVIHDLASPPGEEQNFITVIRRMAEQLNLWDNIIYLPPDRLRTLSSRRLRETIGISSPDQLFLNMFPTAGTKRLIKCFPNSRRVIFGDGIGVNFTPDYFSADRPKGLNYFLFHLARKLVNKGRAVMAGCARYPCEREYRLLLPGLFDESPPPHSKFSRENLLRIFDNLGAKLSLGPDSSVKLLKSIGDEVDSILLLLTSNLSESSRMARSEEIAGYTGMVRSALVSPKTVVVVKPHPRDSIEKIIELRQAVSELSCRFVSLDDPATFGLPFEAVLSRCLRDSPGLRVRMKGLCVSTACLSLEYLYGIPCDIGFGETKISSFAPNWRRHRACHEDDLRRAISRIRSGEFGPPASSGVDAASRF